MNIAYQIVVCGSIVPDSLQPPELVTLYADTGGLLSMKN
jgi:hypothetical protein